MTNTNAPVAGDHLLVNIGTDYVATIEISNGPNNYLSPSLTKSIADILDDLAQDPSVRAVVLCSQGKHFCAGADMRGEMTEKGASAKLYAHVSRLAASELPIVAAVQGAAVGGGVGLALMADFRVATESTRFACNFSRLGFHHGFGLSVTLPTLLGRQKAAELLYTGRSIRGEEALAVGLCDRIANDGNLRGAARELAKELAGAAPLALRAIRRTMRGDLQAQLAAAVEHELAEQKRLRQTEDFREGVRAVAERREPVFQGR